MRHPLKEWRIESYTYTSSNLRHRAWHYWKDNSHLPFRVSDLMTLEKGIEVLHRLDAWLNHALALRLHNERTDESIPAELLQ